MHLLSWYRPPLLPALPNDPLSQGRVGHKELGTAAQCLWGPFCKTFGAICDISPLFLPLLYTRSHHAHQVGGQVRIR